MTDTKKNKKTTSDKNKNELDKIQKKTEQKKENPLFPQYVKLSYRGGNIIIDKDKQMYEIDDKDMEAINTCDIKLAQYTYIAYNKYELVKILN
jgi:hypothetical protein